MQLIRRWMPFKLLAFLLFFPAGALALEVGDRAPNFTADSTQLKTLPR